MSGSIQTLASLISADMNLYAGDPALLNINGYSDRTADLLESSRSDQLTVRVAIHAMLRDALGNSGVQQRLQPFADAGEEGLASVAQSTRGRAKFFSQKQLTLQLAALASDEQRRLKEAHGELAAWEKENAVLLRHQMFMTYLPSQALLLESAATVALYRQYAALEEGQYTSESSDGEVPAQLKKMGGKPYFTQAETPFAVDEHNKMFSQQVLQNKRVEYEQLRQRVAQLRHELEESPTVKRLEAFVNLRNDIFREFGIDKLVSLCARKDRELGEPNEGGIIDAAAIKGLDSDNEYVRGPRVAQYSLAKIVDACHKNYLNILSMDDWDAMLRNGNGDSREVMRRLEPLKDLETFRYWFLSSITADCPSMGPNKIVGKNATVLDDYKKFFAPQKSGYAPSLNAANRSFFGSKVADRRGLPHIVILSPATYTHRENNDPNAIKTCTIDLLVYDMTNEKVLLMVTDSADERRPRGAFLNAQEERYRFAAVVRSAITYENQYHGFECRGTVAEYFFDAAHGPEENYYCVMCPSRLTARQPLEVDVPIKAFRPFTACPPRYFALGANWGVSAGTRRNPYPMTFAHMALNEDAIALSAAVPGGWVGSTIMPRLPSREEGLAKLEEEKRRQAEEDKKAVAATPRGGGGGRTPRASVSTPRGGSGSPRGTAVHSDPTPADILAEERAMGPAEEADPLGPVVDAEALHPLRDLLLKQRRAWQNPGFLTLRGSNGDLKALPAVKDGQLRTPLLVFEDLMRDRHGESEAPAASAPSSARGSIGAAAAGAGAAGSNPHKNTKRQVANVVWL